MVTPTLPPAAELRPEDSGRAAALEPLPEGGVGVGSSDTTPQTTGENGNPPLPAPRPTSDISQSRSGDPHPTSDILSTYLSTNLNLDETAARTNTALADLIHFINKPQTQELIETYKRALIDQQNAKLLATAADTRLKTIKRLETLCDAAADPIEQRRHCNLILRYSAPIAWAASTHPVPSVLKHRHHATNNPSRAAHLQVPVSHRAVTAPATPDIPHPTSDIAPPTSDISQSRSGDPHPTSDIASAFSPDYARTITHRAHDPKLPKLDPLPNFPTPQDLLIHLERHFIKQKPLNKKGRQTAIFSLHRYFTEDATVNNTEVPIDPGHLSQQLDPISDSHLLAEIVQIQRRTLYTDNLNHNERLFLIRYRQSAVQADITLKRPAEGRPWRIFSITTTAQPYY